MKNFKGSQGEWYVHSNGHFLEVKTKDESVGCIASCMHTEAEFTTAVNTEEENEAFI